MSPQTEKLEEEAVRMRHHWKTSVREALPKIEPILKIYNFRWNIPIGFQAERQSIVYIHQWIIRTFLFLCYDLRNLNIKEKEKVVLNCLHKLMEGQE